MTSLTLIELQLKNIKSYKDETINFIKKNNVIIGQNGSGKSTILEALVFGFYNERSQSVRVNSEFIRNGEKKGSITIIFEVNDKTYEIETTISVSGKTTKKLKYQDGREVEGRDSVLADLELITGGIDKDVFKNVIYAEQGQIAALSNLTSKGREELINKLMGLEKYEKTAKHIYQVHKQLNERIERKQDQIKDWQFNIDEDPLKEVVGDLNTVDQYVQEQTKNQGALNRLEKELFDLNKVHDNVIRLTTKVNEGYEKKNDLDGDFNQKRTPVIHLLEKISFEEEAKKAFNTPSIALFEEISQQTKKKYEETSHHIKELDDRKRYIHSLEIKKGEKNSEKERIALQITLQQEKIDEATALIKKSHPFKDELPGIDDIKRILNNHLDQVKSRVENTKAKLDELRNQLLIISKNKTLQTEKMQDISQNKKEIQEKTELIVGLVGSKYRDEISEMNISSIKKEIELLEIENKKIEDKLILKKSNQGKIELDIKRLNESIDKIQVGIDESQTECPTCRKPLPLDQANALISETKEQIQIYTNDIQKINSEIKSLNENQTTMSSKEENLQNKLTDLEKAKIHFSTLKTIEDEKTTNEKELVSISEELKHLSEKDVNNLIEENDNLLTESKNEQQNLDNAINSGIGARKEAMEKHNNLLDSISKVKVDYEQLTKEYDEKEKDEVDAKIANYRTLRDNLRECEQQLNYLSSIFEKQEKNNSFIEEQEKQLANLKKEYSEEERNEKNEAKNQLILLMNYLNNAERDMRKIKANEEEIKKINKAVKVAENVKNVLDKVPTSLLAASANQISYKATSMFERLMPSSEINRIVLSPDYSIKVIRRGMEDPLHKLSGGESTISALCLRMAIAEVIGNLDLMLLDEPTANLDQDRVIELIDVLQYNRPISQLIMVTHNREFDRVADQVIEVSPNRTGSTVKHLQ